MYVGLTLLLSGPVGLPIQAAIVAALLNALTTHFLLQRHFVFRRAQFALPIRVQLRRYVLMGSFLYAVTVAATSVLPACWASPSRSSTWFDRAELDRYVPLPALARLPGRLKRAITGR